MENGWVTPNANPCVNDIKFNLLGDKGMIAIDASNHNMIQKYTDTDVIVPDARIVSSPPAMTSVMSGAAMLIPQRLADKDHI